MENPDTVKVDQKMEEGSLLKVCLEENLVPVDSVKLHESLSRWNIDKSGLDGKSV